MLNIFTLALYDAVSNDFHGTTSTRGRPRQPPTVTISRISACTGISPYPDKVNKNIRRAIPLLVCHTHTHVWSSIKNGVCLSVQVNNLFTQLSRVPVVHSQVDSSRDGDDIRLPLASHTVHRYYMMQAAGQSVQRASHQQQIDDGRASGRVIPVG